MSENSNDIYFVFFFVFFFVLLLCIFYFLSNHYIKTIEPTLPPLPTLPIRTPTPTPPPTPPPEPPPVSEYEDIPDSVSSFSNIELNVLNI